MADVIHLVKAEAEADLRIAEQEEIITDGGDLEARLSQHARQQLATQGIKALTVALFGDHVLGVLADGGW